MELTALAATVTTQLAQAGWINWFTVEVTPDGVLVAGRIPSEDMEYYEDNGYYIGQPLVLGQGMINLDIIVEALEGAEIDA